MRLYAPIIGLGPTPIIEPASLPCGHNEMAWVLAQLIVNDKRQERTNFTCNEALTRLAQARADDMQKRNYFGHVTPDELTVNELARMRGLPLPDWYAKKGNNIESIAGNQQTPREAVEGWWESYGHRVHVFGIDPFFYNQCNFGVGFAERRDGQELHSTIWVIETLKTS